MNVLRDFQQLQQDNCQEIEDNKGKKLLGRQRRNIAMHTPKNVWSIEETNATFDTISPSELPCFLMVLVKLKRPKKHDPWDPK